MQPPTAQDEYQAASEWTPREDSDLADTYCTDTEWIPEPPPTFQDRVLGITREREARHTRRISRTAQTTERATRVNHYLAIPDTLSCGMRATEPMHSPDPGLKPDWFGHGPVKVVGHVAADQPVPCLREESYSTIFTSTIT